MARMKTLYIAMTDPDNQIGDSDLDESRMQAWHDSLRGVYMPELYAGAHKRAYRLGREQIEMTCAEEGFDIFKKDVVRVASETDADFDERNYTDGAWWAEREAEQREAEEAK